VADEPLHCPAQVACVPAHAARVPRGAPVTVTQVPTLPGSWQAWHCPLQALEQQTLSTQNALMHSAPVWQLMPFALVGKQTPVASQYLPALQGRVVLQPLEHLVVSAH
jgi:hypothetical protein